MCSPTSSQRTKDLWPACKPLGKLLEYHKRYYCWWFLSLSTIWFAPSEKLLASIVRTMATLPERASWWRPSKLVFRINHFPRGSFQPPMWIYVPSDSLPSLNVFFVLAGLVWSVQVRELGVYVESSPHHYMEHRKQTFIPSLNAIATWRLLITWLLF